MTEKKREKEREKKEGGERWVWGASWLCEGGGGEGS